MEISRNVTLYNSAYVIVEIDTLPLKLNLTDTPCTQSGAKERRKGTRPTERRVLNKFSKYLPVHKKRRQLYKHGQSVHESKCSTFQKFITFSLRGPVGPAFI